jgi:hypothetical protein
MMKLIRTVFALSVLFFVPSVYSVQGAVVLQDRPIPLGTSGGSIRDSSLNFCCGGTLGALVQDNQGIQYILSNNHVLARTNRGILREPIIQPALIDQEPVCLKNSSDAVANLSSFVPISFRRNTANQVDAAIAKVRSGQVNSSGLILNIGEVSTATVAPLLGMSVKKNGRTTGITFGTITAVDATVDIHYSRQCGLNILPRTARFTGQIVVGTAGFSAGGDSGSVVVEDCSLHPRAVGLLFGGSDSETLLNPMGDVLSQFGVSMVGTDGFCTPTASSGATTLQAPPQAYSEELAAAKGVRKRNEEALFNVEGVVGMGIGLSDTVPGKAVIEVYVKKLARLRGIIPETLENIPVKIVETGEFIAY